MSIESRDLIPKSRPSAAGAGRDLVIRRSDARESLGRGRGEFADQGQIAAANLRLIGGRALRGFRKGRSSKPHFFLGVFESSSWCGSARFGGGRPGMGAWILVLVILVVVVKHIEEGP